MMFQQHWFIVFTILCKLVSVYGQSIPVSSSLSSVSTRLLATNALKDTGTHIYVVMGDSEARNRNIKKLMDDMGLDHEAVARHVTIIPAVMVDRVRDLNFRKEFIESANGLLSEEYMENSLRAGPGSTFLLCCLMSHIRAWLAFQASTHTNALIFEDDANIAETDEIQLLYNFKSSNTYPTKRSRQFSGLTRNDKQMILFNKMLRLDPALWDIQYHGFCWDCANIHTAQYGRHPVMEAKTYYLEHGIDAFLVHPPPGNGSSSGPPPSTWAHRHSDSGEDIEIVSSFYPAPLTMLTIAEEDELARHYFYYGQTRPMCTHAYVINRNFSYLLLNLPGGLKLTDEDHWTSDGYLLNTFCRHNKIEIRPIIPIFSQNSNDGIKSYLQHKHAPAESVSTKRKASCINSFNRCHHVLRKGGGLQQ